MRSFLARHGQRGRLLLRGGGVVAAIAILGATALGAQAPNTEARDAQLRKALTTALLTEMTIVALPPGNSAGHMSAAAVSELRDRLARVLPTVFTGALLTVKFQRLSASIDDYASSENFGENTAAGVTSLTMDTILVDGSHATVHGTCTVWLTGRHRENGQLKDDRADATYDYTAGLDQVNGSWLVSSWDDLQIE